MTTEEKKLHEDSLETTIGMMTKMVAGNLLAAGKREDDFLLSFIHGGVRFEIAGKIKTKYHEQVDIDAFRAWLKG